MQTGSMTQDQPPWVGHEAALMPVGWIGGRDAGSLRQASSLEGSADTRPMPAPSTCESRIAAERRDENRSVVCVVPEHLHPAREFQTRGARFSFEIPSPVRPSRAPAELPLGATPSPGRTAPCTKLDL